MIATKNQSGKHSQEKSNCGTNVAKLRGTFYQLSIYGEPCIGLGLWGTDSDFTFVCF